MRAWTFHVRAVAIGKARLPTVDKFGSKLQIFWTCVISWLLNFQNYIVWHYTVESVLWFHALHLVLCEYSKFRIESNSYFSIRFDSKRVQLFKIFEYLPSLISYFKKPKKASFLTEWCQFFTLATTPSNQQNQCYIGSLWPTKYWNSYNRNHNSAVP